MPRTIVLILGASIFVIGNLMFLNWILGLWFDNFSPHVLLVGTLYFFTCARYGIDFSLWQLPPPPPPCLNGGLGQFNFVVYAFYWGVPLISLTGLILIIYSFRDKYKVHRKVC